ncbi:MAG TPA: hypothetical protein VFT38_11995 [Vicinamibacteria bacterium]|nr:hypothetical protein [Vicinamibacteria bacterium]
MSTHRRWIRRCGLLGAATIALTACGGSHVTRTESAPTNSSDDIGADVPVRVTAAAVKPSTLHLFNGLQVTFVNEDTAARTIAVDAVRSDLAGCAAVAVVLQPGERRTTEPLPRFAACYFRDAQRPAETAFQGVVVTH